MPTKIFITRTKIASERFYLNDLHQQSHCLTKNIFYGRAAVLMAAPVASHSCTVYLRGIKSSVKDNALAFEGRS